MSKLTQKSERAKATIQKSLLSAFSFAQQLTYDDKADWTRVNDASFKCILDNSSVIFILAGDETEHLYTLFVLDAGPPDPIPPLEMRGADSELGLFYRDLDAQDETAAMARADIAPRLDAINTKLSEILTPPE